MECRIADCVLDIDRHSPTRAGNPVAIEALAIRDRKWRLKTTNRFPLPGTPAGTPFMDTLTDFLAGAR
jgi:hypothetical protein